MSGVVHPAQTMERFAATYRVTVTDGRAIEEHAKEIAIEQSVEIPDDVIPPAIREAGIVGRIDSIKPLGGTPPQFDVVMSFRVDNTAYSVPQFLNVLFGNISIKKGIKVIAVDVPEGLLKAFGGPVLGIEGLRKITGVRGRPLACTALKPLGLPATELASMAAAYARGGIDLIKEDHGMADLVYHPFADRVARVEEAVQKANKETGGHTLFFPMVNGGFDQIEGQMALVKKLGIKGVLIAPLLVGPDTVRTLAHKYQLAIMAHPTFTGTHFHDPNHGMTPAILLGTIFRLIGADISVFPNFGGRFSFSVQECVELAEALRAPLGPIKASFPSPAGGMKIDRVAKMAEVFGPETVLLIGGGLMQHSSDLAKSAAAFMAEIGKHFKGHS